MNFNSREYLLFFPVVFLLYWRLPHRAQNLLLLAASLLFYASWRNASGAFIGHKLLPLILFSAFVDYAAARLIAFTEHHATRRALLVVTIAINLSLLGFFKYYNFFAGSFNQLASLGRMQPPLRAIDIILPVGISFYTFQSMSYTIDVYRRELAPVRSYFDFLLYVSYFPQLVAGPIERAGHLMPRLFRPRRQLSSGAIVDAIKLILIGYFHKVYVADMLAPIVDRIFDRPANRDALTLLVGIYGFSIQIYCDFSGYSKIARGCSRLLGIDLMSNFEQPYLSGDIQEFWRRWHISLSTWLRDYIYIPLGGNRRGVTRTRINLLATMLLGGLWHGASWTFVIWGGLHGLYLVARQRRLAGAQGTDAPGTAARVSGARVSGALVSGGRGSEVRSGWARFWRVLVTFHLVTFTWLFFRTRTFKDLVLMFMGVQQYEMSIGLAQGPAAADHQMRIGLEAVYVAIYALQVLVLDLLLERHRRKHHWMLAFFSRNWFVETLAFTAMLLLILLVGENHEQPFIYFQF